MTFKITDRIVVISSKDSFGITDDFIGQKGVVLYSKLQMITIKNDNFTYCTVLLDEPINGSTVWNVPVSCMEYETKPEPFKGELNFEV